MLSFLKSVIKVDASACAGVTKESHKNALEAMNKVKHQGGIKRSRVPLRVQEVSQEEYENNIKVSAYVRAGVR